MNILLRLKSSILYSFFMCLVLSYSLVAQRSNISSFELTQYEFEAGTSQQVDLSLTLKSVRANLLEIQNPLPGAAFVVESVKIITGGKATDIWLTRDSILFKRNMPQTAWVVTRGNSTQIRTASALQSGDQVLIRLLLATPKNEHTMTTDSLTATFPDASKNYMYVVVSLNSTPGDMFKYVSTKPILIKRQGTVK